MSTAKATKEDWDKAYSETSPYAVSRKNQITGWLLEHVPRTTTGRCLEIGCYPGRFLPLIGSLGYELNGIDIHAKVVTMKAWLETQQLKTGVFEQQDFFTYQPREPFDLVLSLGFVEHFENWPEVLARHADFVKPGGLLVVEAPNFIGGFQNWFHRKFNADDLAHHHVPAMDVEKWRDVIEKLGFDIRFCGYFGRFHVWTAQKDLSAGKRAMVKLILRSRSVLKRVLPAGRKAYAPYAGLVAVRRSGPS